LDWALQFYKEQFLLSKLEEMPELYYLQEVARIEEQFGKSFESVLELGAGTGGLAYALSKHGKDVTTIELVKELADFAQSISASTVHTICGDFYEINFARQFDCILYIDGFGVGVDEDQLRLLKRIYNWLNDDGYALIDIYEPNYWRQIYREEILPGSDFSVIRKYDFDDANSRLTDTWWHKDNESLQYTQSLACYSPQKIADLGRRANLEIVGYFPNGAMDYETWTYYDVAPLHHCISYRIKVKKSRT
jgi:SAM-dependent methyltransferase